MIPRLTELISSGGFAPPLEVQGCEHFNSTKLNQQSLPGETMATHKRTEIRIETEQVLIIRRYRSVRAWCLECGCEVDAVNSCDAEIISGMAQQPPRDGTAAKWHLPISQKGSTLVCLESLLKAM